MIQTLNISGLKPEQVEQIKAITACSLDSCNIYVVD